MKHVYFLVFNITNSAGTERAVINLSNILCNEEDFKVGIISISSITGNPYYELDSRVSIYHLGINNSTKNIVKKLTAYKKVMNRIYDIVPEGGYVLGTDIPYNILISFLKKRKKIGCSHMGYKSAHFMRNVMRYIFYRKLDALVVLTENDKKYYSFIKNTYVIPNSLSFAPKTKDNYDSKQILSIGRLNYQKGFEFLIDAAKIVVDKHSDWKFVICGSGEEYEELVKKIQTLKLENNMQIIPPTKNITALYENSSIYVMSSRFEGLPMVLIEAQSYSLPIVSFDCPEGPASIIHNNEDGYLVKLFDINMLAEKICYLIENKSERIRLGSNSFTNSKQFSTDSVREKWLIFFQEN